MYIKKEYKFFKLGELAYRKAYTLYQPIYFYWKAHKDRDKIKLLKEFIKPGMIVVDVGANIGFYSVLFSKMVGETGQVHCFEPEEKNFKHLLAHTSKLKNVTANNAAVSNKSGKIKLYKCDINVDHQTYDNGEGREFTEINCVSLDDYFKDKGPVDLLKTDTQGYDYSVIDGMKNVIKNAKHLIVVTEFWPFGLNKAGVNPDKFVALLKELGFTLRFMDSNVEQSYGQMTEEWSKYTDIVAEKKSA